jgi:hypothetical protein
MDTYPQLVTTRNWQYAVKSSHVIGTILQITASGIRRAALAATLIAVPMVSAQQSNDTPTAPVPAQIAAAHKVFISNAGADITAQAVFKRAGEPDQAYNHFYSAMQGWGRYELVSNPSDADLVFEIKFTAPAYVTDKITSYEPQFELNIVDTKSHFTLWNLAEPVQGAFRKATWLKNFDRGLGKLMDDLKKLAGPSPGGARQPEANPTK